MIGKIIGISSGINISKNVGQTTKQTCPIYDYGLKKDTVSFSGKYELSHRAQNALSILPKLNDLYQSDNLTFDNIEGVINKESFVRVSVKPIKQLGLTHSVSHMIPEYDKKMKLRSATIYLEDNSKTAEDSAKQIANCVHQYTHVLQHYSNNGYYGIKSSSMEKSDVEFLGFIAGHTANDVGKEVEVELEKNPDFVALRDDRMNNGASVSQQEIAKFLPSKDSLIDLIRQKADEKYDDGTKMADIPDDELYTAEKLYNESKPVIFEAVKHLFKMESEAKSAEIVALEEGVCVSQREIIKARNQRNMYNAISSIIE